MSNGTSNRTALRYIAEVTPGTTPATPALKDIRYTGESLNFDRTSATSKEIRSDRNTANLIPVKASSGGDVNYELSSQSFDDFLEAALCGTWSAPVSNVSTLKNGVVNRSFTIQKDFEDMSPEVFNTYVGQKVNDMSLDFKVGAILTGKFGFKGLGASSSNTQITGATVVPAETTEPMNGVSNVIEIKEDGAASLVAYKSLTLSLNNNCREQEAIGSLFPIDIVLGTLELTGNIEAYFSTLALYQKFLNDTSFSLSFKTQDNAGNYYNWTLPKIKVESSKIESGGIDTDIMMSGTWRAIYDETSSCMIQVDRYIVP